MSDRLSLLCGNAPAGNLKVALVWAGRPNPPGRSIPLAMLARLSEVPSIAFISMQTGDAVNELNTAPQGFKRKLASIELTDFAETAETLSELDLLITIDTATAHLAGAMGIPTWLLLQHIPDWRWLTAGSHSIWYPSMRLFRQPKPGSWEPVVEELANQLAEWARSRLAPA